MLQRIKCFFGNHDYVEARQFLLPRKVCSCCKSEIVLLPRGEWVEHKAN